MTSQAAQKAEENTTLVSLRRYMDLMNDIGRATTIICDSITVHEYRLLQESGLLQDTERPTAEETMRHELPKCAICLTEFRDVTLVFASCGHGVHRKCVERYVLNAESRPPNTVIMSCPICRKEIQVQDIVTLKGILPAEGRASAWRTVILTEPWAVLKSSPSDRPPKDTVKELMTKMKSLHRQQNFLSLAMEDILNEDKRIREKEILLIEKQDKLEEELNRRKKELDKREANVVRKEISVKQASASQINAMFRKQEEILQLSGTVESSLKELNSRRKEIERRESELKDNVAQFEQNKDRDETSLRNIRELLLAERRALSRSRNAYLISSNDGAVPSDSAGSTAVADERECHPLQSMRRLETQPSNSIERKRKRKD